MNSNRMGIDTGAPRVQALGKLKAEQVGAKNPRIEYEIVNAEVPLVKLGDDAPILGIFISTDNQGYWDFYITKGEFFGDSRERKARAEDASELVNYAETLLSGIDHCGEPSHQLRYLDEIEKLAASLRARISGVKPVAETEAKGLKCALLQVSKLRWVVIKESSIRNDGIRGMKYQTFERVSEPMPWPDARASIKHHIEELPANHAENHKITETREAHHGKDRPVS